MECTCHDPRVFGHVRQCPLGVSPELLARMAPRMTTDRLWQLQVAFRELAAVSRSEADAMAALRRELEKRWQVPH